MPRLGLGEMPATKSPGQAAGSERDAGGDRTRCRRGPRLGWAGCRRPNHRGWQRARSEMPAGAEAGLAAGRDGSGQMLSRGRRRGVPRLGWQQARGEMPTTKSPGPGLGPGRDSDDQITGAGSGKINSKESAL